VVSFYRRLCIQLEDGLSEADRAQEQERQRKLTQMTGQYYYYPQEGHFKSRIRGLKSDLIVSLIVLKASVVHGCNPLNVKGLRICFPAARPVVESSRCITAAGGAHLAYSPLVG